MFRRKLSAVARRLQTREDGKEYALRIHVHPSILEQLSATMMEPPVSFSSCDQQVKDL